MIVFSIYNADYLSSIDSFEAPSGGPKQGNAEDTEQEDTNYVVEPEDVAEPKDIAGPEDVAEMEDGVVSTSGASNLGIALPFGISDNSDKQAPNGDPEQKDPEHENRVMSRLGTSTSGATLSLGAASTSQASSNLLSRHGGGPKWFRDGLKYLVGISNVKIWISFLESYADLERQLGFNGKVSKPAFLFIC